MQVIETNARKFRLPSEPERLRAKELLAKARKEGEKMTTGIFEFVSAQGGWFDFSYRFYPGEPIRTVKIIHGEKIDIPLDLAKHLNNVYKKVRLPPDGTGSINADKQRLKVMKTSRIRFIPMDVMGQGFLNMENG